MLFILLCFGCGFGHKKSEQQLPDQDNALLLYQRMESDSVFKFDFYGGAYVNNDNQLVVLYRNILPEDFKSKYQTVYKNCKYSYKQLDSVVNLISQKIPLTSGYVSGYGINEMENCIDVCIDSPCNEEKFKNEITNFPAVRFSYGIIEIIDD